MSDATTATDASASTTQTTTAPATATSTKGTTGTTVTTTISSTRTVVTAASTPTYLLGPLTTTFTAPSQCSQAYWLSASDNVYDPTLGQTCTSVDGQIYPDLNSNCLPPVTKSTIIGSLVGSSTILSTSYQYTGYYSPGIACPAGYTTACAAQVGANGIQTALSNFQDFGFIYSATADETAAGCCPTGYTCVSLINTQWCQTIAPTTTLPLVTCVNFTNSASASTTEFTIPTLIPLTRSDTLLSTVTTSTFNLTTFSMLATMVQIVFQATDLPTTSSSSLLSSSSSSSSTSSAATTGSSSSGSNHKTTTIAVAVVIPCLAAIIAAGLAWFWYRRRAKKRLETTSYQAAQSTEPSEMYQSTEPSEFYYRASGAPTEISGDMAAARFEIPGSVPQYEMAGSDPTAVAHEMYAGDAMERYHDDEGEGGAK